jgi:hypothetical protein
VISALKTAGVDEKNIVDAGGSVGHLNWTSKKQLSHKLQIEDKDMQVFANAMASVEQVFTDAKAGFFSGVSCDFSFNVDEPVYSRTEVANEQALRDAVAAATRKATLLAEAASLQLGPIDQIEELGRTPRRPSLSHHHAYEPTDFDEYFSADGMGMLAEESFVDYAPVSPKQLKRIVQLRVRFRIGHA